MSQVQVSNKKKITMSKITDPRTGLWGKTTLKTMYPKLHKEIDDFYSNEEVQVGQPAPKKFPRRITLAKKINEVWQMDLADVSNQADDNDDYKFLLVLIDVLSRYARVIPLKNKTNKEVIRGLTEAFESNEEYTQPTRLSADRGSEFMGKEVLKFYKDRGIYFFPLNPPMKAAIAERFIRTLRGLIGKYQNYEGQYRYIEVLQDLVDNYNSKKHRTIGLAPKDVTADIEREIYDTLVLQHNNKIIRSTIQDPKFQVGDYVRIQRERGPFEKEHQGGWSREIFQIIRVIRSVPYTYHLSDLNHERIHGSFYEPELLPTNKPDTYRVEEIIRTRYVGRGKNRKKQLYVKWLGFPASFNSWIDEADYDL